MVDTGSGIYKIVNTVNNKCYIGSAVNFKKRWQAHLFHLRKNIHHSIYLQNAFNKYGEKVFVFEVIAFNIPLEDLIACEQFYLTHLNPEYNINLIAGGGRLGRVHTKESKLKMSIAKTGQVHTEETKQKLSKMHKGKILSVETKMKISNTLKGVVHSLETMQKIALANTGKKHSKETKLKISQANKGRAKPKNQECRQRLSESLTGKPKSEEHKSKMPSFPKGHVPWNKGMKWPNKCKKNLIEANNV